MTALKCGKYDMQNAGMVSYSAELLCMFFMQTDNNSLMVDIKKKP